MLLFKTFCRSKEGCSAPVTCDLLLLLCVPLSQLPEQGWLFSIDVCHTAASLLLLSEACKVMGCKDPCQCRTFVSAAATRSIAPPIPFTIFPGIIQLARSPHRDTFTSNETVWKIPKVTVKLYCFSTCMAPRMVRPTWPPRIMAKLSSLEKKELPGIAVTVCLPAFIRSGSTCKIYRCWKYFMRVSFTCWL